MWWISFGCCLEENGSRDESRDDKGGLSERVVDVLYNAFSDDNLPGK